MHFLVSRQYSSECTRTVSRLAVTRKSCSLQEECNMAGGGVCVCWGELTNLLHLQTLQRKEFRLWGQASWLCDD